MSLIELSDYIKKYIITIKKNKIQLKIRLKFD